MMELLMVRNRYHPCTSPDARRYQDGLLSDSIQKMLISLTACLEHKLVDYEGDDLIILDVKDWQMSDIFLLDDLKMDILRLAAKVYAAQYKAYHRTEVWENINHGMEKITKISTHDQFLYLKRRCPEVACYLYFVLNTKPNKAYGVVHSPIAQAWADEFWEDRQE